ncbi:MAG: hypothetical protein ABI763_01930 [Bacteroidota bacterium]
METISQIERITQNRIVKLFTEQLGYQYLGNWEDRPNNSNIEEGIVRDYLKVKGYSETLINHALDKLRIAAKNYNENLQCIIT